MAPHFDFEKLPSDLVPQVVDEDLRVVQVVPQPRREDVDEGQLLTRALLQLRRRKRVLLLLGSVVLRSSLRP